MRYHYELVQHTGADMEARYYSNGTRVSRERFEYIETMAHMYGRMSNLWTKARQVGTTFRRTNYKTCQY